MSCSCVVVKSEILTFRIIATRKLNTAAGVNSINFVFLFFLPWQCLDKLLGSLVLNSWLPPYFQFLIRGWLPLERNIVLILVLNSLQERKDKFLDKLSHIHFDINNVVLYSKTFVKGLLLFLNSSLGMRKCKEEDHKNEQWFLKARVIERHVKKYFIIHVKFMVLLNWFDISIETYKTQPQCATFIKRHNFSKILFSSYKNKGANRCSAFDCINLVFFLLLGVPIFDG